MYASFAKWHASGEDGISLLERALKKSAWRRPARDRGVTYAATFLTPWIRRAWRTRGHTQAKHRGYDAGKKVSVIKQHIGVDTRRVAACLCGEHGASDGLLGSVAGIGAMQVEAAMGSRTMLCNSGYEGKPFRPRGWRRCWETMSVCRWQDAMNGTASKSSLSGWALAVGLWNESFAWLEKHRRLSKNGKPKLTAGNLSIWHFPQYDPENRKQVFISSGRW